MPDIEREFILEVPPQDAWAYITDMENFASHLPGFQEFEEIDNRSSIWTVKIDLAMFSRTMRFKVNVIEEEFPRATFELDPLDQPGDGEGSVYLETREDGKTLVIFTISAEASGRMAPFLNTIIGEALPKISDKFIEDIQEVDDFSECGSH